MKVYDEILGREENVHEPVLPEKGKEIVLKDPEIFGEIFDKEAGDE